MVKRAVAWSRRLDRLRGPGARRARQHRASASLEALMPELPKGGTIIDLGCGESGDVALARAKGFRAYGIDLFPPNHNRANFVQANAADLPLTSESVDGIVCHAMAALLSPSDRWAMYREVARVLKPTGLFSVAVYPLADGHPIQNTIEASRIRESGLHRKRAGLYVRCSNSTCAEHPDPDSFEAILYGVRQIDASITFVDTASKFIAWIAKGGSIKDAAAFAGVSEHHIAGVIEGAIACGIFDRKDGSLSLPWLDRYMEDKTSEGNICLVLDVLAMRGEIERINDENGLRYRAKQTTAKKDVAEERARLRLVGSHAA